jgi:large subunit ribosomal protein L18
MKLASKKENRQRRHERIRRKVRGTAERPRMSVMISNKNIYLQFIDDDKGATLAAVSTLGEKGHTNIGTAKAVGKRAAEVASGKGITSAVVDRGGYKFHGRIKAIVEALNQGGVATGAKEEKDK